jgi:tRNA-2-methylthio-N6-dimethylallyladenosine synthase
LSERKENVVPHQEMERQKQYMEKVKAILHQRYNDQIPMAHVHSYGCQQNVSDGEKIKGMLALMGYGFCETAQEADLVLYNTCAVRENAEDRVFGNVGALKHCKRRNPNLLIGLCGCMMQQEHIAQRVKKSFPYVDFVFGTHVLHRFPEILYRTLTSQKRVFETPESDGMIAEHLPIRRDGTIKAWVPIMYGCNNFCTYCIVPYVRGRERSRASEEILSEIRRLIADGYKEITLLGQNVNSYGKGLEESINFSELLRKINAIEGDFRIRFMTSHPKDATTELIDTIAECEKVCKHLHLPVQSGSDRILKLMNRHYTKEEYLSLIRYAKEKIPDISFTSDIIVGFPGETREDFLETLDLIRTVEYDSLFTFIYSKRVGTKAAQMDDPISDQEKSDWFTELLEVQKEIGCNRYDRYVGKTVRVLVDGEGKTGPGYLTGRTNQFIIVDFPGKPEWIGHFVDVTITKALNWALLGEIADAVSLDKQ